MKIFNFLQTKFHVISENISDLNITHKKTPTFCGNFELWLKLAHNILSFKSHHRFQKSLYFLHVKIFLVDCLISQYYSITESSLLIYRHSHFSYVNTIQSYKTLVSKLLSTIMNIWLVTSKARQNNA